MVPTFSSKLPVKKLTRSGQITRNLIHTLVFQTALLVHTMYLKESYKR